MQCFRCQSLNFNRTKPNIFGLPVLECSNCEQEFFIQDKLILTPVELLGTFEDIAKECVIINCNFCDTKRHIAIDCTNLNMQSCRFCNIESVPVEGKIPLNHFLADQDNIRKMIEKTERSPSIDGDTPVS